MNSPLRNISDMSNKIDKYIIITFSIVNNPDSYHPRMSVTENCSSKLTNMWAPDLRSLAEKVISTKSLGTPP